MKVQLPLFNNQRLAAPATYRELAAVAREQGHPRTAALLEASALLAEAQR